MVKKARKPKPKAPPLNPAPSKAQIERARKANVVPGGPK